MKPGDIYTTNNYGKLKVVNYKDSENVLIEFLDTGYEKIVRADHIREGKVKDPFFPNVYGVGYIGKDYTKNDPIDMVIYKRWAKMLERAYSDNYHSKRPTYKDCTVDERWHNFQNFIPWHHENYIEGYDLDKDLYIEGNKVYGPDTCFYVPRWLNCMILNRPESNSILPTGVYANGDKYVGQHTRSSRKSFKTIIEAEIYYNTQRLTYYIHQLKTTTDYIPPKLSRVLIDRYTEELKTVNKLL